VELVRVDSTAVYAFGYDDEQRTLDVVFYRSGVYRYFDVPREVYDNWLTAESKGLYLHQALIGYFAYERLRPVRRTSETAVTTESEQPVPDSASISSASDTPEASDHEASTQAPEPF
jgi:hypothetical protein